MIFPDCPRMTILFFCLGGLDILKELDKVISDQDCRNIVEWIYSQQVDGPDEHAGFRGGGILAELVISVI